MDALLTGVASLGGGFVLSAALLYMMREQTAVFSKCLDKVTDTFREEMREERRSCDERFAIAMDWKDTTNEEHA